MPPFFSASARLAGLIVAISTSMAACGGGGSDSGGSGGSNPPTSSRPDSPQTEPAGTAALEVLVPAYFYPSSKNSEWDKLNAGAAAYPDVKITAIMNPSNGVFDKEVPAFTTAMQSFQQHGGAVIGYVNTKYAKLSLEEVRSNINDYLALYPSVQGVFLDEMEAQGASIGFYQQVASHVRSKNPQLQIVGNPGTPPKPDYAAVADTLVSFEGQAADYRKLDPQHNHAWIYQHPASVNAVLVHDASSCEEMQSVLRNAQSTKAHTGFIYVTDRHYDYQNNIGNPWATLPSYWLKMLQSVDALNKNQPLPSCTSPA